MSSQTNNSSSFNALPPPPSSPSLYSNMENLGDMSDSFDPNTFQDPKIKLVSNMFLQKMKREQREQRKLESQLYCKPSIHEFAMCVTSASLLAPFKCRKQHKSMVSCLLEYMDNPELSVYREDFNRPHVFNDMTQRTSVVPKQLQAEWRIDDLEKLKDKQETLKHSKR